MEERTNNEELALTLRDTVEICRMRGSDDEFCLVVSKESYYGLPTNEYHTFHSRDAKFTFMKSTEYTEMAVLRDGAVLWDLSFTTKTYNALRGLYFDLTEHQDQLRVNFYTIYIVNRKHLLEFQLDKYSVLDNRPTVRPSKARPTPFRVLQDRNESVPHNRRRIRKFECFARCEHGRRSERTRARDHERQNDGLRARRR